MAAIHHIFKCIVFLVLFCILIASAHVSQETVSEDELVPGGKSHCPELYKQGRAVCTLFPESIEGPFYRSNQPFRRDVREGKPGVALTITVTLAEVSTCKPIRNVSVDIWSADAAGEYSAFVGVGPDDPNEPTDNTTFLRGVQRSDRNGKLRFITIFPGWYEGRTVHIHMGIHLKDKMHTVQLYFDEASTKRIASRAPYSQSKKARTVNKDDDFYVKEAELKLQRTGRRLNADVLMAMRLRNKK